MNNKFRGALNCSLLRSAKIVFLILCASIFLAQNAAAAKKKLPAHPIDLNTATLEQLEELPGVGPVTAKRILEFREKSGPFKSVNDLLAVPRISKARLDKMRPYITVGPVKSEPKANPKLQLISRSKSPTGSASTATN